MNETLIGVLVGGLIGWIAPLLTLWYGERRWKFEAKLAHLKAERDRFERLYEKTAQSLSETVEEKTYSYDMYSDIKVLMPKEILDCFHKYAESGSLELFERQKRFIDLLAAMKTDLKARDARILKLLEK